MTQRHEDDYGRHRGAERRGEREFGQSEGSPSRSHQQSLFHRDEQERERWGSPRYRGEQGFPDVRFGRNVGDVGGHSPGDYRSESRFGSSYGEDDESTQYYGTQRGLGGGQYGGRGDFGREDLRHDVGRRDLGETDFNRTSFGSEQSWRGRGSDYHQDERDSGSQRAYRGPRSEGSAGFHGGPDPYGSQRSPRQSYGGLGSTGGRDWYSGESGYRGGQGSFGAQQSYRQGSRGQEQSYRGRGPRGYSRTDDRLREIICEMLTEDPAIDAGDITVTVTEAVVLLDGTVMDRWTKYQVEELTENVSGVKDVRNQLRIDRGSSQDAARSQSGSQYTSESQFGGSSQSAQSSTTSQGAGAQSQQSQPGSTTSKESGSGSSRMGKGSNAT